MPRRTCLSSPLRLGTLAVFALLPMLAQAQDADEQAVKAANGAFYAALSRTDEAAMGQVWVHAPYVAAIHPGSKAPIIGWEAVQQSWTDNFTRFPVTTVTPSEPMAFHRNGNTAWIVGTEAVHLKDTGGKEFQFTALATNVYEFQNGHWLMVVHHASLVPQ
ncbi:MAG: nuclear transport factor 2 family protein [Deltaproteobacteria bacterium]|nr:nuclear transport factor 2 family protein [Deltaproteobacteria bacterium]